MCPKHTRGAKNGPLAPLASLASLAPVVVRVPDGTRVVLIKVVGGKELVRGCIYGI